MGLLQAAAQLGSDASAIRLAGVYAMASLADDWDASGDADERRVCVDVLCAYLRTPPTPSRAKDPDAAKASDERERQVRSTIVAVIREHRTIKCKDAERLTETISEVFSGRRVPGLWTDLRLKLGGAYLREANLADAYMRNADLIGADLRDADLSRTYLRGADLRGADMAGAFLLDTNLEGANLRGADLDYARYDKHTKWPDGFDPASFPELRFVKESDDS